MAFPVKPTVPTVPPAPTRQNPGLDYIQKADATMAFLPTLVANNSETVDFNAASVDACAATALAGTLPSLTGKAGQYIAVNSGATAAEFQPPATVRSAIIAGSALQGLDSAHSVTGALLSTGWNFAAGATEPLDGRFWESSVTGSGITATRIATGIDPITGESFADYRVQGTASATGAIALYRASANRVPASVGQTWTESLRVQRIAGNAPPANNGVRLVISEIQSPSTIHFSTSTTAVTPATSTILTLTRTVGNALSDRMQLGVEVRTDSGQTVDYTLRIQGYQFELAAARTAGRFTEVNAADALRALGAGRRLISTQTVANVASVDFSSLLLTAPSGCYEVEFDGVVPATSNALLRVVCSTDGGATFDTSPTAYAYAAHVATSGLTTAVDGSSGSSVLPITTQGTSNTASAGGLSATLRIKGVGQSARRPSFVIDTATITQSGTLCREMISGQRTTLSSVNSLRFAMSAGNIASGTISLYEVIR